MYADVVFHEQPRWSRRPGRRLALNFLPATLIVAGVLAVLRLPVIEQTQPLAELFVRILVSEVEDIVEQPFVEEPVAEEEPGGAPTSAAPPAAPVTPVTTEGQTPTDWYAQIPEAAKAVLDAMENAPSVNPNFDEKRRLAAEQFRPSEAPVERPIWENTETDTLGRTVLVSGDCYRVINDPNVGSREAFLTFGQYITMCSYYTRPPQELGFVKEIRARRANRARYGHPPAE